jgi:hypothetical protein
MSPAQADIDAAELHARVVTAQMQRAVAARELRDMGISPSPADTEAWITATPQQKRRLAMAWAVMQVSYYS